MRPLAFEVAAAAVDAARRRALELGDDDLVIPYRLEECDRATIETALAAPDAGMVGFEAYPEPEQKVAVMLYTLAKSQACVDGNKRTAVVLAQTYLAINGLTIDADQDELAGVVLMAAESERNERDAVLAEVAEWLKIRLTAFDTED